MFLLPTGEVEVVLASILAEVWRRELGDLIGVLSQAHSPKIFRAN